MSDIKLNGITYPASRKVAFPGTDGKEVVFDLPEDADAGLNAYSERPVQNKVIYAAVKGIEEQLTSPFNFKGTVADLAALNAISNPAQNDTYYVVSEKCRYSWTGSAWKQSSMEESEYTDELSAIETDLLARCTQETGIALEPWAQGSIYASTGHQFNSTSRCRTEFYASFDPARLVSFRIADGYKLSAREYTDKYADSYVGTWTDFVSGTFDFRPAEGRYYKFVIGRTDDGDVAPEDLPENVVLYDLYQPTDRSLTTEGKAADAKITGEYLRAVDHSNNLINQTLRPSVASLAARPKILEDGNLLLDHCVLTAAEHGVRGTLRKNSGAAFALGFRGGLINDNSGLETGVTYTLSCDAEYKLFDPAVDTTRYFIVYLWEGTEDQTFPSLRSVSADSAAVRQTIAVVTQDKKGIVSTARIEFSFSLQETTRRFLLVFRGTSASVADFGATDYIELRNLMLQKGTRATAWRPSFEDLAASVRDLSGYELKLQQLTRPTRTGPRTLGTPPLCLIHFSDIHGDATCLQRILAFRQAFPDYIQDILHTGDSVTKYASDGMDFWDETSGAETILNCIGNHDTRTSGSWIGLDMQEAYSAYFAPYIASWGAAYQPGKTYYYKDYPDNGVRLIVLDIMHQTDAQLEWFRASLESARTAGLDVVAACHSRAHWRIDPYVTAWDDAVAVPYTPPFADPDHQEFPSSMTGDYAEAVDAFMDAGGDFVCWLHGHSHYKIFAALTDYPGQLDVAVANAGGTDYAWTYVWARIPGTESEDDFNLVAIDTESKILRMAKVGVSYDRYMRHVDTISYNYRTHQVICCNG